MLYLHLDGNRDNTANKELSDYRSFVIYITRNLKGNNRTTGLLELDNNPISMEERVEAHHTHCNSKNRRGTLEYQLYRWNLCLLENYGHAQLRTPAFLTKIKHCKMPDCNLSGVDLRGMYSLEVIDLSGNNLTMVEGLRELSK